MGKVLLVVPNIKSYDMMPCLSVAMLKGYLMERTNHTASIVDLVYHRKKWKTYLLKRIREEQPDLLGVSVLSFNYPEALEIARLVKKYFDIPIIFGGVHVILSPQEVLLNDEVDMVCTGEGEEVVAELLDRQLDCSTVKGVWYKQKGKVIKNDARQLIEDLDHLPFPDFEDFNLPRYFISNHSHLPIMASRGCPYSCTYCSNHALRKILKGKYVRFRSVDNVMKEIQTRIDHYKKHEFKYLYFFDDTFILDKNFIHEFCTKFIEKGFHRTLQWTANVRANLVTNEVISAMKKAGCYEVRMGVESGNDFILNKVYHRNMTKNQLHQAFKIIKKHGLQLRLDFIYGAPFETVEMMEESFEFAQQSQGDRIFFSRLYPFPGTAIKKICENEQVISEDLKFGEKGMPAVDRTKYTDQDDIQRFAHKITWWQMKRYLIEGFRVKKLKFFWDVVAFLLYYKHKYDLEWNQVYRWNIQRYRLQLI